MSNYLFAYGTLQDVTSNSYAQLVHEHCVILGKGYFFGTLKDFGTYPGAQIDPKREHRVHGTLFQFNQSDEKTKDKILEQLDYYEGYLPSNPEQSLFLRKEIEIYFREQKILAFVYLHKGD